MHAINARTIKPDRSEAPEYFFTYIDQVPDGDICQILEAQAGEMFSFIEGVSDVQSSNRYHPTKWSIREVLAHVNDTERVFVFRAFWFARGFDSALPSFDQHIAMSGADADPRSWSSHIDEFRAVRAATLPFFQNLSAETWSRRGIANGHQFTVRALAYIVAGHVFHHMAVVKERYLRR
jgi:hypothetical protein